MAEAVPVRLKVAVLPEHIEPLLLAILAVGNAFITTLTVLLVEVQLVVEFVPIT